MAAAQHHSLRTILIGLTAVLGLLLGAPAAHAKEASAGCPGDVLERPFEPWGDIASYTLAPDGDFTGGGAGWELDDGAEIVDDNEPWYVHGGDTPAAVSLERGQRATTPQICVTPQHPTMRFFARSVGDETGTLEVEVLFGQGDSLSIGNLAGGMHGEEWAPSDVLPIIANFFSGEVRFRFTALRSDSAWVIDDVYVDPYGKG